VGLAVALALGLAYAAAPRLFGGGEPPGIAVSGTVEARQVEVSARIAGRIRVLLVREGDRVAQGQVVARLEDDEAAAEVQRQEAALAGAEATLRDLEAGPRREEIDAARATVAQARARLDELLAGTRRPAIEEARAALAGAEATRVWTERDLARARELYGQQLIAAQEVDRARQAFEVAAAQERSARERLTLAVEGARPEQVAAARAELEAAEERLALLRAGTRPAQIEAARHQVGQARSALALARARLREMTLVAPTDGVVLHKSLEAGEMASPGVPVVTLMDPRDVWVRAYLPEEDVGRVRLGDPARVRVDAYQGRDFAGRVTEIASEAEFTPRNVQTKKERVNLVFRIKIAVDNPAGVLKPGMPADATLRG
jgi:HlyD family secretion protein